MKVRENRLRRAAARQGFILQKSARRDHRALDYGKYRLINSTGPGLAWTSLDAIEAFLYPDFASIQVLEENG